MLEKNIEDAASFLVDSNAFLALGASSLVSISMFLLGMKFSIVPLFLGFAETFFIYNLNRYTDIREDRINVPKRFNFIKKNGKPILAASIFLYVLALAISYLSGIGLFLVVLMPTLISFFYGVLKFKRIFLIKNLLVGFAWGTLVLIPAFFFNDISAGLFSLYIFFSLSFFINTVVFDVKDIKGDRICGIKTLPSIYGIRKTKLFLILINTISLAFLIFSVLFGILPDVCLSFILFSSYIYIYIMMSGENRHRLFYGLFVDGEFLFFMGIILAMTLVNIL